MKYVRMAAIAALLLFVSGTFLATRLAPAIMGVQPVRIVGGSMEPTIPYGSLAYVDPVLPWGEGDIVTFASGANLITHRVIHDWSGNADLWMTQGDANEAPDAAPVTNDQVLGPVVAYAPFLGIAYAMLAEPVVIAFLALLGVALIYGPRILRWT